MGKTILAINKNSDDEVVITLDTGVLVIGQNLYRDPYVEYSDKYNGNCVNDMSLSKIKISTI